MPQVFLLCGLILPQILVQTIYRSVTGASGGTMYWLWLCCYMEKEMPSSCDSTKRTYGTPLQYFNLYLPTKWSCRT